MIGRCAKISRCQLRIGVPYKFGCPGWSLPKLNLIHCQADPIASSLTSFQMRPESPSRNCLIGRQLIELMALVRRFNPLVWLVIAVCRFWTQILGYVGFVWCFYTFSLAKEITACIWNAIAIKKPRRHRNKKHTELQMTVLMFLLLQEEWTYAEKPLVDPW